MRLTREEKAFLLEVLRDKQRLSHKQKVNAEQVLKVEENLRPSEKLRISLKAEGYDKERSMCESVLAKLLSTAAAA